MGRLPANAALLLVDVQRAFELGDWGERNQPDAERRMAEILAAWRDSDRPVIHVQHLSKNPRSLFHPDQPGSEIQPMVAPRPGEKLVTKYVNSAFIGTDLEQHLRDRQIDTLVIAGLTTDHCVSTTTRMAGNLGFSVYLVADATATFGKTDHRGVAYDAQQIHDTALASLHGEFAEVVDTAEILPGP